MAKKRLKDEEIADYLAIPSGSEDGENFSEAESDEDIAKIQSTVNSLSESLTETGDVLSLEKSHCLSPINNDVRISDTTNSQREPPNLQPNISGVASRTSGTSGTSLGVTRQTRRLKGSSASVSIATTNRKSTRPTVPVTKRMKRKFIWKKKAFQPAHPQFTGDTKLQPPISEFETPLQYFAWFFDDELLGHITEEMHKFSVQKDPTKPFLISIMELKKFLGVCLIMSLAPLPNIRMYWASELGIPLVMDTMTLNQFKKICQFLHFNDNTTQLPLGTPGHDRLHKIRPVLETLRKKCQSVPKREALAIDEQMCATKASNLLRQYLPNKPHKWGYKLLVLCDDRGFAYNFEIYSGMENDPQLRDPSEPDLGASSNIVVRLARCIPRQQQYRLFFDNCYTSPEFISYLSKEGILSLGTLNKGRLGKDLTIPSIKDLKKDKVDRGFSEEWVADVDGEDIVIVMWYDNKPVILASSFVGRQPIHLVRRYCKKQKKYLQVNCPQIVKTYNQHMGGVDLLDSFLGKYKIKMRTRKWYLRLFYHIVDIMIINAWLLYRRVGEQKQTPTPLKQKDFKFEVAKCLCMCGRSMMKKKGRPSSLPDEIEMKRKKANTAILPPTDVRRDGFEHFPIWGQKRQRCKLPGCKGKTYISCEKCLVELCLNKDNNCFRDFHQK